MKKNQRNIIISFCITGVFLVMLLLTTYAAFNYSQTGRAENKITSGTVSMSFLEDSAGIQITNAYPILDEEGKKLVKQDTSKEQVVTTGYFDFTVSADVGGTGTIGYDIYLKNVSTSPAIPEKYIKVYLTDSDTEAAYTGYTSTEVPTYDSFSTVPNEETERIIYHDTFKTGTASKKFRLRLWVASTYGEDETSAIPSKNFKVRVGVKASQIV